MGRIRQADALLSAGGARLDCGRVTGNPEVIHLAHGAWRHVEAATAARDIAVGAPWTFSEHRTMAQVIAEEVTAA